MQQIFSAAKHPRSEKFTTCCSPQLHYFTIKLVGEREEAEDIVIQSFTKLFDRHAAFDSFPNIRAFLYITCRNACFNYLKFRQRNQANTNGFAAQLENEASIEQAMIEAEVLKTIYAAIEKLPAGCKTVFKLIYFEGLPHAAIADQLNITISTVRNQRKRAIMLLRGMLNNPHLAMLASLLSADILHRGVFF